MIKSTSQVLPKGWKWTQLEEIAEIILGQSPPSSTYNLTGQGLPFYQGKSEFEKIYPIPKKYCTSPNKIAEKGDVLISVRAPVGPTNICPEKSCIGRGLAAIHPLGDINSFFILYFIRAFEQELSGKGTGTTFNAIRGNQLREFDIPLPPFCEQGRIVRKLEELFTKLDAGVASLQNVKAQLQLYRQAVLKHAFNGKLTEKWRRVHKNEIESVTTFASRTMGEQKAKQVKIVSEFSSTNLPNTWAYAKLGDFVYIAGRIGWKGLKASEYVDYGPLLLSVHNINRGKGVTIDLINGNHLTLERYEESPAIQLRNNDILLVKDGAGIGKIGIIEGLTEKATVNSSLLVIRGKELFEPKFLLYFLMGPKMQLVVNQRITGSATPHLFQRDIKKFELWIPPVIEQRKIVEEIESCFSVADEIQEIINVGLLKSERLRQGILKTAFDGKLIAQDPADEPAEILLERIRKEKEKTNNNKKRTRSIRKMSKRNQRRLNGYVE